MSQAKGTACSKELKDAVELKREEVGTKDEAGPQS